jgi:hypothetical protein
MNKVMKLWERTKWLWYSAGVAIFVIYWISWTSAENQRLNMHRQSVVCPSFLSMARNVRDTLIVMRNDPLCNSYVLDNLN